MSDAKTSVLDLLAQRFSKMWRHVLAKCGAETNYGVVVTPQV
jgi:hypothetical protein